MKKRILNQARYKASQGLASSFPININKVGNHDWSKKVAISCIVVPGSFTYQQNEFLNAFTRLQLNSKTIVPVEHIVTFLYEHELLIRLRKTILLLSLKTQK